MYKLAVPVSLKIVLICFCVATARAESPSPQLSDQRQWYKQARSALDASDQSRYQALRERLHDYPLLPYLDYQQLQRRLKQATPASLPYLDIDRFLDQQGDTYLGKLLLRRWLDTLASHQRWHEYRTYYSSTLSGASNQCLYLWSRFKTGDRNALSEVTALWNVAKSQPKACDTLFAQWRQAGYMTQRIVWDRYRKALIRNNLKLTRYLETLLTAPQKSLAQQFRQTLNQPERLANSADYDTQSPFTQDIIYHSLSRYARKQPDAAWQLWQQYRKDYDFSDSQQSYFYYRLARAYAFKAQASDVKRLLSGLAADKHIIVVEIMLRKLLKQQNWQQLQEWIALLPAVEQQTERWRYWQARANEALFRPAETFQPTYTTLAANRSFYGFLSADLLKQPYQLQNKPTTLEDTVLQSVRDLPALQRARELFFLNKMADARQEWRYGIRGLSPEQFQAAAQLTYEWGWYRKSIEAMAAAEAWNDLQIRFPVAHEQTVLKQAQQTNLPPTLIFAIARQESAWESDARSHAGAMGLMQLLPRTARDTASKAGIVHTKSDLFKPEHNIRLGSRYISELLDKYDNNRLPAIAAYNAGPSRVNRWLRESGRQLPHDVWVEVIPFNETRKYVQNVLSYSVVYAYRMGEQVSMLTQAEASRRL